ncbi:MAG: AzlD domain-containing protein [Burkholderiales bacterium]|nr:AzlD domain-containing protein [Burkholderiales bacterium]
MNAFDVWLTIALLTVSTILTRSSFFMLGDRVKLPAKVQHALRYAPAAALAAIVAPDLALTGGALNLSLMNPKLLAAIGATLFFLRTRHMLGTITFGMGLYAVLRLIL